LNENNNLELVDCNIVSSSDTGWDYEVKKGVYKLRIKNDGTFEQNHLGDIVSQKIIGIGFFNSDTKERIIKTNLTLLNPTVNGNEISWSLPLGCSYKLVYINDQFKDVLTISQQAKTYLKNNKPAGWTAQNTWVGIIYDMDLSQSSMIESKDFETDGNIRFIKDGRIKHRIEKTVVKHSSFINSADENVNIDKSWSKKKFYKNGKYIEAIPVKALESVDGSLIFNTVVSFQEGVSPDASYTGTQFWGMRSTAATKVYLDNAIWSGEFTADPKNIYRGSLIFDVSSIPSSATVTTATFTLTFVAETVANDYLIYLYEFLKPWNEPAATAEPASDVANDPCWSHQYYDETAWGTAGAGSEDVDRNTNIVASNTVTSATNTDITFQSESMDALVEDWIDGTKTNYGIQVAGQEDGASRTKYWASPTYATAGDRPELTIDYTTPGGAVDDSQVMMIN
jgi:hypothetical protein